MRRFFVRRWPPIPWLSRHPRHNVAAALILPSPIAAQLDTVHSSQWSHSSARPLGNDSLPPWLEPGGKFTQDFLPTLVEAEVRKKNQLLVHRKSSYKVPTEEDLLARVHTLVRLGFSKEQVIVLLRKINLRYLCHRSCQEIEAVFEFIKSIGLEIEEVSRILTTHYSVLLSNVEMLKSRAADMERLGFDRSSLKIACKHRLTILLHKPEHIQERLVYFMKLGVDKETCFKLFSRCPLLFSISIDNSVKPKIEFLRSVGMDNPKVLNILTRRTSMITLCMCSMKKLEETTSFLQQHGFELGSPHLARALLVACGKSDRSLKEKLDLLSTYDLSATTLLAVQPSFLHLSTSTLKEKLDYFSSLWGLGSRDFVGLPRLLTYSLEKRIKPRRIWSKWLESQGLLTTTYKFATVCAMSNAMFKKKFIEPIPDGLANYKAVTKQ